MTNDLGRAVRIDSYFSAATDLAIEMHSWPEFFSGPGFEVTLKSEDGDNFDVHSKVMGTSNSF